jgi:hypothetical protein
MPHRRLADTPLFPLFVVMQILPETWPKLRRMVSQEPSLSHRTLSSEDDNRIRMERLMRAIDETRSAK